MEESEYFVRAVTIAEELNQKLKKCDDIALSLQHVCISPSLSSSVSSSISLSLQVSHPFMYRRVKE